MSKCIIYNGSFREISDELMHWKYTKREKVNGEWVYTYPNDKLGIKRFIDTKITGKAYKQHTQEAREKQRNVDNEHFSTHQSRIHAEETAKGYSQDDPKVKELKKKENDLSKKSKSLDKEAAKAAADYENKSLSGNVKKAAQSLKSAGKDWIDKMRDELGFDEREKYRDTDAKRDRANAKRDEAEEYSKNVAEELRRSVREPVTNTAEREYLTNEMKIAYNNASQWRKTAEKRGKEATKAWSDCMNTPLGKVAKVTTAASDWLSNLFSKKNRN